MPEAAAAETLAERRRFWKLQPFDRGHFVRAADGLAVALAASLPWSTSATTILSWLWLLALIPTFDLASLRRLILIPAGGLPWLLVTLGAVGMLWADVTWAERLHSFSAFLKLGAIPLLFYQFSRSGSASYVLFGFLVSCVLLLIISWCLFAWPGMPWPGTVRSPGVPVKDYIAQGAMFTVCIFALMPLGLQIWGQGRRRLAIVCLVLALVFLINIFCATSRTSFVVIPILLILFGYRRFGWKGAVGLVAGFLVLATAVWPFADYMQLRIGSVFGELRSYQPDKLATPAGERLVFWKKSIGFLAEAPLIGHGTGSIREQFARTTAGHTGMAAEIAENPHNQILAVGIQIGLVGIATLLAMWATHLTLFRPGGLAAWIGLVVVVQNIVASLFNSHLFDFTNGSLYVVGVGIAGGVVLKETGARSVVPVSAS
jgi:hypothetical protein